MLKIDHAMPKSGDLVYAEAFDNVVLVIDVRSLSSHVDAFTFTMLPLSDTRVYSRVVFYDEYRLSYRKGQAVKELLTDDEVQAYVKAKLDLATEDAQLSQLDRAKRFDQYWQEQEKLTKCFTYLKVERMLQRGAEYLRFLNGLVAACRLVDTPITWDNRYVQCGSSDKITQHDLRRVVRLDTQAWAETLWTPEHRWWTQKLLEAIRVLPGNVAATGVRKHLRGLAKKKRVGYDPVFTSERGWKDAQVEQLAFILFTELGYPLLSSFAPGYDGDYLATLSQEEREKLRGNRYAVTQTAVNKDFVDDLLRQLMDTDRQPPPAPEPKIPSKPRKVKQFKVGDKVTARNMRDVPAGSILQTAELYYIQGEKRQIEVTWLGARSPDGKTTYYVVQDERYGPHPRRICGRDVDRMDLRLIKLPPPVQDGSRQG